MVLKKEYRGFTLIELMVVMAIIAVLATLIIGAVQLARNTATETANRANVHSIETALESNYSKYRRYCYPGSGTAQQTGELACTSASVTGYSVSTASTTFSPNVTLGTGYSTTGTHCVAAGSGTDADLAGGGRITTLNTDGYILAVASSNCGGYTSIQDLVVNGNVTTPTILPPT